MILAAKAWLMGNLSWIFLGTVLALLAALGLAKYQLANARTELAEYKNGYLVIAQAAKECSAGVAAFEAASIAASKRAEAAIKQAKESSDSLKLRGSLIAHLKPPKDMGDCNAADQLINSVITGGL